MKELTAGITGSAETTVTGENTALKMGSGSLSVFATPAMTALMEQAAWQSVQPYLDPGQGTVGTWLEISHLAATAPGRIVRAESELCQIDRRRLVFSVRAYCDGTLIGEGTHERFIVDEAKFLSKLTQR